MNERWKALACPGAWSRLMLATVGAILLLGTGVADAQETDSTATAWADTVGSAPEGVPVTPADSAASSGERAPAAPGVASDSLAAPSTSVTPNRRPSEIRKVRFDRSSHNVLRSGPGERFSIVGVHPKGAIFPVVAKSGDWYNVRLSPTETGWVHSALCTEFDDLSDLEFQPNPRLYTRTGSYVLSGYGGAYAFDRKSNSLVLGGRLGYYVFDRLQAEAGVAWTHVRRPAEIVESLFDLSLEAKDFHMLFYHLDLVWELLPGRQMVPFVCAGVGSAIMQGETEPTFNFGAGTLLYVSKRMGVRWEVRDYNLKSGTEGARFANHNVEFTLGSVLLF